MRMVEDNYYFTEDCQVRLTNKMTFKLRPMKREGGRYAALWERTL